MLTYWQPHFDFLLFRGQKLSSLQALPQTIFCVLNQAIASVLNVAEYQELHYVQNAVATRFTVNHAHKRQKCVSLIARISNIQQTRSFKLAYAKFRSTVPTDRGGVNSRMYSIKSTESMCLLALSSAKVS